MVNYDAKVYTLTEEGMQGIEVVISDESGETLESIQVTNQTQFNELVDTLDNLNLKFPAFADGSTLTGRSVENILRNDNEDVEINATTLSGFQSDELSKVEHTHDDRYFTESEITNKLANHNHSTWETISGVSNGTLYVNKQLRLAFLQIYIENGYNYKKSHTYYTIATIPSGYRPKIAAMLSFTSSTEWGRVLSNGNVTVARDSTGTVNISCSAMWCY